MFPGPQVQFVPACPRFERHGILPVQPTGQRTRKREKEPGGAGHATADECAALVAGRLLRARKINCVITTY